MGRLGEELCRQCLHVDTPRSLERLLARSVLRCVASLAERKAPAVARLQTRPAVRAAPNMGALDGGGTPAGTTRKPSDPGTMRWTPASFLGLVGFVFDALREHGSEARNVVVEVAGVGG